MQDMPRPALCLRITNTAILIRRDTAEVLGVVVGDVGTSTDAGEAIVCTNVPTHVVITMGTLHVEVAGDLTLGSGGIERTVFGTLVVTCL